ncbi:MAG: aldo/keto reductase family oxidoreductase [Gammaproteobacteria bacterium]
MPYPLPLQKYLPTASHVVCGAMTISTPDEARAVIDTAIAAGITMFDHADIYNAGRAEAAFGTVLKASPGLRDDMIIQSKCGIRFGDDLGPGRYDWSRDWIVQSVESSLKRLHTDFLDVLLLHRPDPLMDPAELNAAFEELHAAGKVRHFGVSNQNVAQMMFLDKHLERPLVANQIEMSLLHSHWVDDVVTVNDEQRHSNRFSSGTVEHCRHHGIQLQAWSSLCQGMLSGRDTAQASDAVKTTAAMVTKLANTYEVSREAIVLGWLLRHPAGIQPIIGSIKPERIRACAEATKFEMTREDWWALYVSARDQRVP